MKFIFGALRSTVVGGDVDMSSQQSSQKSSNGLKRCAYEARGNGGRGEIRTHGTLLFGSFQDCCLKPLGHPSLVFSKKMQLKI